MRIFRHFSRSRLLSEQPLWLSYAIRGHAEAATEELPLDWKGEEEVASCEVGGLIIDTSTVRAALGKFHASAPTLAQPIRLRQQFEALIEEYSGSDPDGAVAVDLLDCVFGNRSLDVSSLALRGRNLIFACNLLRLRTSVAWSGERLLGSEPVTRSSRDEDCLAGNPDQWSVLRVLNLAVMASIPVRKRAAIVTSIRNEGLGILKWLAHHCSIGFTFYVYTNGYSNRSDDLFRILAGHGIINSLRTRSVSGLEFKLRFWSILRTCFRSFVTLNGSSNIDGDEFFVPRCESGLTLDSYFAVFVRSFPSSAPSSAGIGWPQTTDDSAFARSNLSWIPCSGRAPEHDWSPCVVQLTGLHRDSCSARFRAVCRNDVEASHRGQGSHRPVLLPLWYPEQLRTHFLGSIENLRGALTHLIRRNQLAPYPDLN